MTSPAEPRRPQARRGSTVRRGLVAFRGLAPCHTAGKCRRTACADPGRRRTPLGPRRGSGRPARRGAGFTLLELLLVLAVLVVIAALAMPAFHAPLENHRLRKSGERMRIEWSRARIRAMKTGRVQAFYYTLGGNQYWVETLEQADDLLEAGLSGRTEVPGQRLADSADPLAADVPGQSVGELPENVLFVSGGTWADSRDSLAVAENQSVGSGLAGNASGNLGAGLMTGTVAAPILFYPDGTTATARLVLGNSRNHFVLVELRGLTGIARTSDLLTADELPP